MRFHQAPESWAVDLLAYAAGIIDADGNISIRRDTYAMRRSSGDCGPVYRERVSVKQVEPEAITLLHESFGGSTFIWTPRRPRSRPMYSWQIVARMATVMLTAMLPYLRIKRRQAELCLELRKLNEESRLQRFANGRGVRGGARRSAAMTLAMVDVRAQMLRLNRAEHWLAPDELALLGRRNAVP